MLVFATAAAVTAVLSLDATVVLLTPVVLATAARLRQPGRPHVYACGHLANSSSSLLPVSNLTNLLAFAASGLSFLGFTALMALPWAVSLAVEYAVLRWWFRADLRTRTRPPPASDGTPTPRFALVVLGLTLVGFGVSSPLGVEPVWVATAGALVLAARALRRRTITPLGVVRAAVPLFCAFVLGLGVVVAAVGAQGLTAALRTVVPDTPSLPGLLVVAGIAAVLANVVNNLPATLLLLAALGSGPGARDRAGHAARGEHRAEPDLRRQPRDAAVAAGPRRRPAPAAGRVHRAGPADRAARARRRDRGPVARGSRRCGGSCR